MLIGARSEIRYAVAVAARIAQNTEVLHPRSAIPQEGVLFITISRRVPNHLRVIIDAIGSATAYAVFVSSQNTEVSNRVSCYRRGATEWRRASYYGIGEGKGINFGEFAREFVHY